MASNTEPPLFSAVSSAPRQLSVLLKCIAFAPKTQVRILPEGLRFSTEQTSVMEAFVFLSKSLFTTYSFRDPSVTTTDDQPDDLDPPPPPTFQVSLPALLEVLQIFSFDSTPTSAGPSNPYSSFPTHRPHRPSTAFSPSVLGAQNLTRITYASPGSPLSIHLSDSNLTTTADLTTYDSPSVDDIPFSRDILALKTIMRASHLADAIAELAAANPESLVLSASPRAPYLALSGEGALGAATVEFERDEKLLETFVCEGRVRVRYRFGHVKAALRAMMSASKVSVRVDGQGVLSLQFLVEVEGAGRGEGREGVAFVDFRIVPLVEGDGESGQGSDGEEDE